MSLLKDFDQRARTLAGWPDCQCGLYKPAHTTYEGCFIVFHYGLPGTQPVLPENRFCKHRRIKLALIRAYRKGRRKAVA